MHWLRPYYFLLLIPLPFILWRLSCYVGSARVWQSVCDDTLMPYLSMRDPGKQRWPLGLLTTIWLLATIALAGPAWHKTPQLVFRSTQPQVIILSLAESMMVADLKPSRLTRAKFKLIDLLRMADEGQVGFVVYTGEPFVVSPLTNDSRTIMNMVPVLEPGIMPLTGNDLVSALKQAHKLLKQVGAPHGDIIVITDNVSGPKVLSLAKKYQSEGYATSVLGVGTKQGGPVPLPHGGFAKDGNGALIIAKMNLRLMRRLANVGGGIFAAIATGNQDVDAITRLTKTNRWSDEFFAGEDES